MMKQTKIQDYFKPIIQDDPEELCRASAVMESMVDRLYDAENNLETNIKRAFKERDKVEEFENISIQYFKNNGKLHEWFIKYKLGQKLTVGYNLINEDYEEVKYYSVGYKGCIWTDKLEHWRFHYDFRDRDKEAGEYLKKIFNNYFFDKKVWIYSRKGTIWFKIVDEKCEDCMNDNPWSGDDWIENCGYGTTEIINRILSEVHKQVFVLVRYKKKTERRLIGEFKNGKPKYKNFMVDDLTKPIYKFA